MRLSCLQFHVMDPLLEDSAERLDTCALHDSQRFALQGVFEQLKKKLQFPHGFLPGQSVPQISQALVPESPVVVLIDSASDASVGPVAVESFKEYL